VPRDDFYRLTGLELASGWVAGVEPPERTAEPDRRSPVAAMEEVLLAALADTPCVVAFSGGRDSSAILALAVALARREGLAQPVAVTQIFTAAPESEERGWQEMVIAHLGVEDWVRLSHGTDMDVVGPLAAAQLRRHGVLWPSLLFGYAPLFEVAAGGCLVTGEGGDEALGGPFRATPVSMLLRGRARPSARALKVVAGEVAPRRTRRTSLRDEIAKNSPVWLRPRWRNEFVESVLADELGAPLRWDRAVTAVGRRRSTRTGLFRNLNGLAAEADVTCRHPFLDAGFLSALARAGGPIGFPSRTAAMQALFNGLAPGEVLSRTSKALFNNTAVTDHARSFLDNWSGAGIPEEMVDVAALMEEWRSSMPDARSFPLLQAAWLADQGGGASSPSPGAPTIRRTP
jgi:hypothetical protein